MCASAISVAPPPPTLCDSVAWKRKRGHRCNQRRAWRSAGEVGAENPVAPAADGSVQSRDLGKPRLARQQPSRPSLVAIIIRVSGVRVPPPACKVPAMRVFCAEGTRGTGVPCVPASQSLEFGPVPYGRAGRPDNCVSTCASPRPRSISRRRGQCFRAKRHSGPARFDIRSPAKIGALVFRKRGSTTVFPSPLDLIRATVERPGARRSRARRPATTTRPRWTPDRAMTRPRACCRRGLSRRDSTPG